MSTELTELEIIAGQLEDLAEIMPSAFDYMHSCFAAIQDLPPENHGTCVGLAKLGRYQVEDWGNQFDCTLEHLTKRLRELNNG